MTPFLLLFLPFCLASLPDPGVWNRRNLSQGNNYIGLVKNAYNNSRLDISINCQTDGGSDIKISVGYALRRTICWEEFLALDSKEAGEQQLYQKFYEQPSNKDNGQTSSSSSFVRSTSTMEMSQGKKDTGVRVKRDLGPIGGGTPPVYRLEKEGIYLLVVHVAAVKNTDQFTASVHVEMKAPTGGYLSVTDWPLLPFYGTMCGVYVVLGLAWLIVCAMHWRDILRIQFWIGGVIFLGMVEKAMFCAEYQNINNSGEATEGLILAAEVVSSGKRTLARMLVIIVSLGFGIVKP